MKPGVLADAVRMGSLLMCFVVGGAQGSATAGQPLDATLRVTVSDATGGIIVGARVTVLQTGAPGQRAVTGDHGEAVLSGLVPGEAELQVESDGFEPAVVRNRRIRPGLNRLAVRLELA